MTSVLLLYSDDKDLKDIQQIVTSSTAANLVKQAIEAITDLALMTKIKQSERSNSRPKTNKEYFNCEKKGNSTKECHFNISNKNKSKEISEESKQAC